MMAGMRSGPYFASATSTLPLVSRVMKPHSLRVVGTGQRLDARMHHLTFGDVSLSRLNHGAEVRIEPGELDDFFLFASLQMLYLINDFGRCHGLTMYQVLDWLKGKFRMFWAPIL